LQNSPVLTVYCETHQCSEGKWPPGLSAWSRPGYWDPSVPGTTRLRELPHCPLLHRRAIPRIW